MYGCKTKYVIVRTLRSPFLKPLKLQLNGFFIYGAKPVNQEGMDHRAVAIVFQIVCDFVSHVTGYTNTLRWLKCMSFIAQ